MQSPSEKPLPEIAQQVDMDRLPRHVAIITDGNGRWATSRGLHRNFGHAQGYEALKGTVDLCGRLGIGYLTTYSFSSENWRRSAEEVSGLMSLIEHAAREQIENLDRENVRFNIIGRLDELPQSLRDELQRDMDRTCDNTGLTFTLAINYGGRAELVDAARALVRSGLSPEDVTEESFAGHLYTAGIPDPDLLIRTAGEKRISNYLLWQIAYAEIHVTDVLWPDFTDEDFLKAILDYQHRTRKFGGVVA
jgi:undecaprenyl diphosphate synthase